MGTTQKSHCAVRQSAIEKEVDPKNTREYARIRPQAAARFHYPFDEEAAGLRAGLHSDNLGILCVLEFHTDDQ